MQDQIIIGILVAGAYITGRVVALRESVHQINDHNKLKDEYKSLQRTHNELMERCWEATKKQQEQKLMEQHYWQSEEEFLRDIYGNVSGMKEDRYK